MSVDMSTTFGGVATVDGAFIVVVAIEWLCCAANAGLTRFVHGAGVAVVARCAVGSRRVGAQASGFVARADDVTSIGRAAHDGIGAGACTCSTGVGFGARVVVIACCSIR